MPQADQWSALPRIHEFWHAFYSWASFTVYHRWKTSRWCYTSAMEKWTLSGMGCYLSRHLRQVCNLLKQCTNRFSGSKGGTQQIAELCWHYRWCWLHSFCHRDIGSLGRAGLRVGIRDWSTFGINDAWATFYNLSSPTYLGGCRN